MVNEMWMLTSVFPYSGFHTEQTWKKQNNTSEVILASEVIEMICFQRHIRETFQTWMIEVLYDDVIQAH